VGHSRYMAVADYTDEHDRQYRAGEFITGTEYERLGEPDAFKGADYPSEVDQLREEHGLDADEQMQEAETPSYVDEQDLDGKTVDELRELAAAREIEGRSSMNKQQLIDALRSG
jgi:hypothetical protein